MYTCSREFPTTAAATKRLIKIELCVRLSVVRLSQVGHVVQNGKVPFRFLGTNGFHAKAKNEDNCCGLASSSEPKIREFKKRPWQLQI